MEKLTFPNQRRGPNNGIETGKNEKSHHRDRSRNKRGAQADIAREQEGRRSAGLEMEERDWGEGIIHRGNRGRGGRLEVWRGGDRWEGGAVNGGANGGGVKGLPMRSKGGGGAGKSVVQKEGGTGRNRAGGAEGQRGGLGRNGKPGEDEIKEVARRGGQSVDGRRARGGHRRTGSRDRQISNGGRSQSTGGVRAPMGSRLGYKTLEDLSGKDPSVVAITLSSSPALHEHLCATEMRQDLVQLLCLVLSKAFKAQGERGTLQHLASIIKDSGFFRTTLPYYLVGMVSESDHLRRAKYPQQLENILTILHQVLSIFPASSVQAVSLLLTQFQGSMNSLSSSGVDIHPEMKEKVKDLQGLVLHLQEKSRDGTLHSKRDNYSLLSNDQENPDEEKMQQDFRTIPIYPHPEEFQQDFRPFLRPNLVSRPYKDTHFYLDTHFRLLREDFVKPLRDAVQQLVWLKTDKGFTDEALKAKRHEDILVYFDAQLLGLKCTNTGLAYTLQFDNKPLKYVRWENSKRLIYGSLVCLSCDNFKSLLFATVSERDPKQLQKGRVQVTFTERSRLQLAELEDNQVFIIVESTAYFEAYRYVLEGLQEQREDELPFQRNIVECRTDLRPPAYLQRQDMYNLSSIAEPEHQKRMQPFHSLKEERWPTMEKLGLDESQMKALKLALTKELAIIQGPPGTGKTHVGLKIAQAVLTNQDLWRDENGNSIVLVVCYTNHALDQFLEGIHKFLKRGIVRVGGRSNSEILKRFNLREISRSDDFKRSLPSHLRMAFKEIFKELREEERKIQDHSTKLECSWKGILHENFLQEFMSDRQLATLHRPFLAQQVWEANKQKFSPIMEWLGVGSIVFQQRETEYGYEYEDAAAEEEMEVEEEELIEITEEADLIQAERIIDDISPRGDRDHGKKGNMKSAVREVEKLMLAMNLEKDEIQDEQHEGEWEMQPEQKKKLMRKIKRELQQTSTMPVEEAEKIHDVWALALPDRWRLYRLWVARYRKALNTEAVDSKEAYQNAAERLAEIRRHEDLHLLIGATVIGMTTTGAARYRSVLQQVRPRLVIVEEAAQVFEAHTITTLSQACQHLILIGDHQQLHPTATVYGLAKNFNLEISMFERMVNVGVPYVRLNYQHRMRPDIARLLTPHIYPTLENHSSVLEYDDIKGLKTNLFFVEHNHPEEMKDAKSHQNQHEAMFVVALCRYLLLQDYQPEQITILTTYTSQFHCLRNLMPASQFSGVRVHVVDKYQGEENDIILLSLVRSNSEGKVGFLSIPNRVCVALSRAKKGLYCIGNSQTLSRVKLWTNIFHTLRENNQMGKALTLCCQNHPDRQVKATCGEDFQQAPEGGCTQPCQFRLDCGHVCASVCHPYDPEHKKYKCAKQCQKILCDRGHKCPLVCCKECPKCSVKVQKIIPQCEHTQMVPCHQDPGTFKCKEPCPKMLSCGHPCKSTCGESCTSMCQAKVSFVLKCGHSQQDACFCKTQIEEPVCRTRCEHQLKCGHVCQGSCARCYQGRFHVPCFHQRERLLVCSHNSKQPCFQEGSPCQRPCENCCVHSECKKRCGQRCTPCTEPCSWHCPHQRCSKLCSEPCDRPPCTQPCGKTLKCGHPCIGLCGDKCPSKCRICDHAEVTEIFFGTEDDPEACFIQLEDCGHIIEYTSMDRHMGMDDNQLATEEEVAIKLKECPKCRTPVRKNLRYGAHINRSLAEIELVKMKMNAHAEDIEKHRAALQGQWEERLATCERLQKYRDIDHILQKPGLTEKDLWVLENTMAFLTRVSELIETKEKMSMKQSSIFTMDAEQFERWLHCYNQHFTEQQVFDLERQLQRLTLLAELNVRCHEAEKRAQSRTIQLEVQTMTRVLHQCGQFTEQDQQRVKETMKELNRKLPHSGLGIGDEERKMIVSAMNIRPGHWYKCPNGHVYVITECGGAMENRKCHDCDATIGGASHRLAAGNQVASEMDGALHAAWSEANNLLNFEL